MLTDNEIRLQTKLLGSHSATILGKIKIGLLGLSEVIQRSNLTQKEAHDLFNEMALELDGVRAIIFMKPNGDLEYDSFNYPVPNISLKERQYFIDARRHSSGRLVIAKSVIGKTSNIPFLPVALRINKDGEFFGVLTAVVTPTVLVSKNNPENCVYCISLLTDLDGNIIADHPKGLVISVMN